VIVLERPNEDAAVELQATLDRPLPESIPLGQGTAVFCVGTCFHPRHRVVDLTLTVGGMRHRPLAWRMPRPDAPSYRSGFWAIIPVESQPRPTELEVKVEARLADGTTTSSVLGTIAVVEPSDPPTCDNLPRAGRQPLIAICMATFNPSRELFRAQVESIRAQTDRGWICVISDDCSDPARFAEISEVIADDPRFVLSRSDRHLSFYRNFERSLGMVPGDAEFVALSDHDDRWYPEKLEALRDAIGSAELAYSDVRRVDERGVVRSETLWEDRRNNDDNLASLLISNTIVGASCLFRRRVIDHALPFPAGPGWDFHDHWLATVAMALGDVAYVARPLYDYVQHPGAVLGRVASNQGSPAEPESIRGRLRRWRGYFDRWRSAYFLLYLQRKLLAQVLLVRCGRELSKRKRRELCRLVAAEHSPLAFGWLALRPARALLGRNETLGIEGMLARGVLWRRLIALRARGERPGSSTHDASVPAFDPDVLGSRQRRWLARR
jgi:glycosyltransferase involved in cell wall biosynthesis